MTQKLADFDKKEKAKIEDEISANAASIGQERYSRSLNHSNHHEYGLCNTCNQFNYARTAFTIRHAKCSEYEITLNQQDPITECTNYAKRGALSLNEMYDIALIITPPTDKIGF